RLNVSPRFNYSEEWLIQTERRTFTDSTNTTTTEAIPGFFALRQFNTGISATTTIYGLFPLKVGPYQGFRHTLRPSLGFSYRPDFGDAFWGYSRALLNDSGEAVVDSINGEAVARRYNIARGVQTGRQQALTFSLNNIFETKRVSVDSTGEQRSRAVKLFDVNVSSSYNFAADSLNLSPIRLSARTKVFGKLDLNFSSTFSPYAVDTLGRAINRYVFSLRNARFARLTDLRLGGSFKLRSKQQGASPPSSTARRGPQPLGAATTSSLGLNDPFASSPFGSLTTPDGVTDFSIPWSLDVTFNYSLSKFLNETRQSATVNARFDFNLTPNWKIRGQTGYDFELQEIVTTSLNIHRDFGCWEMAFRWVPFGRFQSWGFDLHVKSGHLRDLLRIRQPRSDRDRGFGNVF
ncbi:MAG: putative LPS assembly protein LptD, partial [Rhodothermales bacterium]